MAYSTLYKITISKSDPDNGPWYMVHSLGQGFSTLALLLLY